MKKMIFMVPVLFFCISLDLWSSGEGEKMIEPDFGIEEGQRFQLNLEPGPYYSEDRNLVVYRYTVWPQVAVWLETEDGDFIKTLYVTRVIVDQDFTAAPREGRPEVLPVWTHLTAGETVDTVTSATTVDSNVAFGSSVPRELESGTYIIKLETNRSYDWNEQFTKKNSGVNGQPSLIYQTEVVIGGGSQSMNFTPVGTGSVDGSDGDIRYSLEGIDTAMELFSSLEIYYEAE